MGRLERFSISIHPSTSLQERLRVKQHSQEPIATTTTAKTAMAYGNNCHQDLAGRPEICSISDVYNVIGGPSAKQRNTVSTTRSCTSQII